MGALNGSIYTHVLLAYEDWLLISFGFGYSFSVLIAFTGRRSNVLIGSCVYRNQDTMICFKHEICFHRLRGVNYWVTSCMGKVKLHI